MIKSPKPILIEAAEVIGAPDVYTFRGFYIPPRMMGGLTRYIATLSWAYLRAVS